MATHAAGHSGASTVPRPRAGLGATAAALPVPWWGWEQRDYTRTLEQAFLWGGRSSAPGDDKTYSLCVGRRCTRGTQADACVLCGFKFPVANQETCLKGCVEGQRRKAWEERSGRSRKIICCELG